MVSPELMYHYFITIFGTIAVFWTKINGYFVTCLQIQGGESAFRPINQGYVHQGSCSSDSCMKQENCSDSNTDNSQNQGIIKTRQLLNITLIH